MLKKLRHLIGRRLAAFRFYREWFLDARRYLNSAKVVAKPTKHVIEHLESDIVRRYHVIEKGLSMPDFRPRFGGEMVGQLRRMLLQWESTATEVKGGGSNQIAAAHAVLRAYSERHEAIGVDVSDILGTCDLAVADDRDVGNGGVTTIRSVTKEDADAFQRVVESRTSVRNFRSDLIPDRKVIGDAVAAAIRSPSVCNRQTWRVHAYEGGRAQEMLALQNGNRGFGHTIPVVLVITSDMRYFTGAIERYQAWIDGGMFSMTLLLALHAKGLGAVPLNWSVLNDRDCKLRKASDIPAHERIIMLIGCGYPKPDTLVAVSQRRPVRDFIRWDGLS